MMGLFYEECVRKTFYTTALTVTKRQRHSCDGATLSLTCSPQAYKLRPLSLCIYSFSTPFHKHHVLFSPLGLIGWRRVTQQKYIPYLSSENSVCGVSIFVVVSTVPHCL